jgi:hypothetical protein
MALACGVIWLATIAVGDAQHPSFTFGGFDRDMDLALLLDRYPQSAHELTPGPGVRKRTSLDDEKAWMREVFHTQGSGSYVLRMTPTESHDHLHYVQAEIHEGVTERLWLSFESPLDQK